MRTLVFSTHSYDRDILESVPSGPHRFEYTAVRLDILAAPLARGFDAVCCFVDDKLDKEVLEKLAIGGTRLVLLRCTGFNNVDLAAAERVGITVMRVSHYSPYSVAEFTVGLMLTLNRKIHRAYNRVREGNFRLGGLLGFDLHGKTVGIIGTGRIGSALAGIMMGFGCRLLAYDPNQNSGLVKLGVRYVSLSELLEASHIVSLHLPLTSESRHLINAQTLASMRQGAMLINTSRGALVDTMAAIDALKKQHLGALGLDVYEEEGDLYFNDHSGDIIGDDVFARLLTFPNVLVTGHQAFFTQEAMNSIVQAVMQNLNDFALGRDNDNRLLPQRST